MTSDAQKRPGSSLQGQGRRIFIFKERLTCVQVLQGQFLARYFHLGDIPGDEHPDDFSGLGQLPAAEENHATDDDSKKERVHSTPDEIIF